MSNNTTVLLVDDDPNVNAINAEALEDKGYNVVVATTLDQAESIVRGSAIDVVVLDNLLPDGLGLDLCRKLASEQRVPILFLSAMGEVSQRVEGLKAGGDDYLTKPYHIEELLARVEALTRRSSTRPLPTKIGHLEIDYVSQRVYLDGEDTLLKPREFAVFKLLLQNRDDYLSAVDIYRAIWKANPNGDIRTVYAHISRLRRKLDLHEDDRNPRMCLEHDRTKGYRLAIAEV